MPEEFDPAWEYYEPDPYVAWVFAVSGATSGFDGLLGGTEGVIESMGLRFGSGNPNQGACFKPARERLSRRQDNGGLRLGIKTCPQCKTPFQPARDSRTYCSIRCRDMAKFKRRPRTVCSGCGRGFDPRRPHQVVCSVKCGSLNANKTRPNKLGGLDRFREMYESGVKVTDAARELGISPVTAKKWRRRLDLAPRGPRGKVVYRG